MNNISLKPLNFSTQNSFRVGFAIAILFLPFSYKVHGDFDMLLYLPDIQVITFVHT